jgi:hypothetical protein
MVKKPRRRSVYVTTGLRDAGVVMPPTITSMTLLASCFFDGTAGPGLLIIPSKYYISDNVMNHFTGSFKVRFLL